MSNTPIRRTNWTANPQGDARPAAPAPQNRHDPHNKDFLGFSEEEFEAAFRSLEKQTASPPVREGSVFKKEPVFEGVGFKVIGGLGTFSRAFRLKALLRSFDGARVKIESVGAGFEFLAGGTRTAGQPPPQDYSRTFAQTLEEVMRSGLVTVIAVTGVVFVAVIGALIYSWVGVKNTGEPIVSKADTSPVKMAAAETEQPSSDKLIYDRLGSTGDSNNEKIVSREEQPVDNLQAPDASSSAAVPAARASPPRASSTTPRVILPNPSAQETGTLNAPRQVPTTTIRVRPDGTMENNADTTPAAPAPAAKTLTAPPVAQAVVPRQPSPSETNAELAESPPSAAAEDVATPAVRTATPPKPVTKPQAQPLRKANDTSTTRSAVPSSGARFVVQVSSQKSQDLARASFPSLQARFPRVLTGYQPSIKAVTLGVRGTHYRVRVGPLASRDEASALCGRLKAAGGDCVVTPN
jgi:cell division septation protein DedD